MTTYDDTIKALGGHYITDGDGTDYGAWTPNTVKTLIIAHDGVYVERHGKTKGELTRAATKPSSTSKSPLRALSHKQFGALETIVAPASMFEGVNVEAMFSEGVRLGGYYQIPDDIMPPIEEIARSLRLEREAYLSGHPNAKADPRPLIPDAPEGARLSLATDFATHGHYTQLRPFAQVVESYQLAPNVYASDQIGGTLETYLSSLKAPKREQMRDDTTTDAPTRIPTPDEDTPGDDLADRLRDFEASPHHTKILALLKASLEKGEPYTEAMASQCRDLTSLDTQPGWWPTLANHKALASKVNSQSRGVLLDAASDSRSAALYLASLPQDERKRLGFEKISRDITIDTVLAALNGETTSDNVPEEAMTFYRGPITAHVESVLKEYDHIFKSGYSVLQPAGVLTCDEDGQGRLMALSSDGRAYQRTHNLVIMHLWEQVQAAQHLTPMPTRNINEIAEILINGKDRQGNTYPNGTRFYFPYKMLEYAFGRESNDGTQDLYPRHSDASSWDTYREREVEKSLQAMLTAVVRALLKSEAGNGLAHNDPAMMTKVATALKNICKAMTTCVLVSAYDNSPSNIPVKVKVRVLTPYEGFSENVVERAIVDALGFAGGTTAQCYDPINDGIFWEFRHDMDKVLANASPVWAGKILDAMQRQGRKPNANNMILGIGLDDDVVTTGKEIKEFNDHTSHGIFAGSRSGKGLTTQQILAMHLIAGIAPGLGDNKPDMASLLLSINPDAFVINGSNIACNPEEGTDMFMQYTAAKVAELEARARIPEYLNKNNLAWAPGYTGTLGTIVYLRYMILALGMLAARTISPEIAEQLGGKDGICIVFDEISNTNQQIQTFFQSNMQGHMCYTNYEAEWAAWEQSGFDDKKKPKQDVNAGELWFTSMYFMMRKSFEKLSQLRNAGFNNAEAKRSRVFMIGQDPVNPVTDISQFFPAGKPLNASTKNIPIPFKEADNFIYSYASIGKTDVLIGHHPGRNYLNQLTPGSYASDKLSSTMRCFAYVPGFSGDNIHKIMNGDEAIARTATYLRPGLLFADGSEDGYCWNNSISYMKSAGVDVEAVRRDVSTDTGELDPSLGFEGYLAKAGVTREQAAATLQKLSDAANLTVRKLGYEGTWQEWVSDLRPQWIASVEDIYNVFQGYEYDPQSVTLFRHVCPQAFESEDTNSGFALAGSSGEEWDMDDLAADGEQAPAPAAPATPAKDEHAAAPIPEPPTAGPESIAPAVPTPPKPVPPVPPPPPMPPAPTVPDIDDTTDPNADRMAMPDEPDAPAPTWDYSTSPVRPATGGGYEFNVSTPRTITPTEMTPDAVQAALYADMNEWAGTWARVKRVGVVGETVIMNGVAYRTQVTDDWRNNQVIPPYMTDAIRSSNIAPIMNWTVLREMPNLRRLSFDSWDFYCSYVCPDLGYKPDSSISQLFADMPLLQHISIEGEEFDRQTWSTINGTPSGVRRYDEMQRAMSVATHILSSGQRNASEYTRKTWQRTDLGGLSKTWRITAGLTGTLAMGAANVASRGVRGLASMIGGGIANYRKQMRNKEQA